MKSDIFGKALLGYFNKDISTYIVRRDDGFVGEPFNTGTYFNEYSEWKEHEKEIIKYASGRTLDIGAGAGRHTLYFQNKGLEVHAVDISGGAVKIMRKRGIKNVYLMDLRGLNFPENYFDSILMMFNNFGLAGSITGTKKLLKTLYKRATPKGKVIATIRDPYKTDKSEHLSYHKKNKKAGRPAGLIKIRIEYKNEIGDWFKILMVSPDELKKLIQSTGWKILKIAEGPDGTYGVVLEKSGRI